MKYGSRRFADIIRFYRFHREYSIWQKVEFEEESHDRILL